MYAQLSQKEQPSRREWRHLAFLAAISISVLFFRLGQGTLKDWDEAIYAQVAKEMIETGKWLTPTWGLDPWFHKPPLMIWGLAGVFKIFGVSEFWARLIPALAGAATVLVTYAIGARLYGRKAGLLASVILLSMDFFLKYSRMAMMDVPLTLLYVLSIYDVVRWREGNNGALIRVALWTGLALMLKSAAAVILPVTVMLAVAADFRSYEIRWRDLAIAAAVLVLLVSPWHLLMAATYKWRFVQEYVGYHILQRTASPLEGNSGSAAFYLKVLVAGCFPWFAVAVPGAIEVLLDFAAGVRRAVPVLAGAIVAPLLYSGVQTKLIHYVIPALPFIALLTAGVLHGLSSCRDRSYKERLLLFGGLLFALVISVQQLGSVRPILSTLAALASAALITAIVFRRRPLMAFSWVLAALLLLAGARHSAYNFDRSATESARIAAHLRTRAGLTAQPVLLVDCDIAPAVLFYGDRRPAYASVADVQKRCSVTRVEVIADTNHVQPLQQLCPVRELAAEGQMHYLATP